MKHHWNRLAVALSLLASLQWAPAQGTAFTYQGQLSNGGSPASGSYDLTFTLFGTNSGGLIVAGPLTNSPTVVSNGLFAVTLDFGNQFNGSARWLEIGVRTNAGGAFTTLAPRQALTPTPYAIMAESANTFLGTLPAAQLSGAYSNQVTFSNGADTFDGSFYGQFFGSSFIGGNFVGNFIGTGSGLGDVWHTGGNLGTTPAQNFLGTTDNQPLLLKVNNQQVERYEPTSDTPNVIGGWSGNYVQPGLSGVTISGGGASKFGNQPNVVINNGSFGTIGGGSWNTVTNWGGAVLGGAANYAGGAYAAIGAGQFHTNLGDYAFIGGGQFNSIQPNNYTSLIGAGNNNTIQSNAYGAIIGGGNSSTIQTNADHALIASGWQNLIEYWAFESVIGGGALNDVGPFAQYSVVGGGHAGTNLSSYAFLGGGNNNQIQSSANESTIGGGSGNSVQGDAHGGAVSSTIAGGYFNSIQTNSALSVIGGGYLNVIQPYTMGGTIAGGSYNIIQGGSNFWASHTLDNSTIGGGAANTIQANATYSTIAGGIENVIQTNANWSTIGGGAINVNGAASSTIGGGFGNVIQSNAVDSVISGGNNNTIQTNAGWSTVGGGTNNILGVNALYSTIGGGENNAAGGLGGTVPGGNGNSANGLDSFAAGTFAQATNDGSFVLADLQYTNFYSTTSNQLSARFTGGVRLVTGGAGMTLDGQPVVAGTLPAGGLSGTYSSPVTFNNPANAFTGNGASLSNVNAATLGGLASTGFWKTTGNAGTSPGANFIGTTDNQALLIRGNFVGIGRSTPISGADAFSVEAPAGAGSFGGMYVNVTNATAQPFYGYAQAGTYSAYHYVDGTDANKWKLYTTGGVRITVTTAGFVGIGTTAPDAPLSVSGIADKTGGGSWAVFSDRRLKKNIEPLTGALNRLLELRPVTFEYKDPQSIHEASGVQIGMVAQEVEKVFPDWVDTAPNGMKRLSIHGFEALTVQALRELRTEKDARIAELEKTNAAMQQELATQREANRRLENRFTALERAVAGLAGKLQDTADTVPVAAVLVR